ncbi:CPBP family intramembrane glutamic endopeptidase [Niveibacterium sp. SC-1]|uniref:CPBP family intramembrane glutamic endopeptidase n=1 Tax=Niveibacterium sp. SC-1 TaxID=3135646 RepID=UPI00311DD7BD
MVALAFGWAIVASLRAVGLGFPSGPAISDAWLLRLTMTELLAGAATFALLRFRGYAVLRMLPVPNLRETFWGLALFVLAGGFSLLVVGSFSREEIAQQPIVSMVEHAHVTLPILLVTAILNGVFEETFLLAYLQRAFHKHGASLAIGVSLLVRMLYHVYQGPLGVMEVLVFGAVLSVFYWRTGRLWPVVFAHVLADVVSLCG